MAHALKHAESNARTFGGKSEDYLAIHNWLDESKCFFTDFRHRHSVITLKAFSSPNASSASQS